MFSSIINKIAVGITTIATVVGSWFGLVPDSKIVELENQISRLENQLSQNLGAFYQVGGDYYQLWGSGVTASATSIILQSLQMPVSDQELIMDDFGDIGYATIEPGSATKREFISFTGITQDGSSEKATLTGVSRGLSPTSPYTASTTLQLAHSGGAKVIFSNSPAFYAEFALRRNAETIWGNWTYSATNTPQYNEAPTWTSASHEFASVKFVEDTANQGAATSSEVQAGVVEIVNATELGNSANATGSSGAVLVLQNRFATSTSERATSSIAITESDGKLNQNFIDLNDAWAFNSTTTIGNAITDYLYVNASTTFYATTSFTGATSTFDRIPILGNATPTDQYHAATKSYVDSNVFDFGTKWNRTPGTTYQATSSAGFVVYNLQLTGAGDNTTARVQISSDLITTSTLSIAVAASPDNYALFTVPIKKNDYWNATTTDNLTGGANTTLWWIPATY